MNTIWLILIIAAIVAVVVRDIRKLLQWKFMTIGAILNIMCDGVMIGLACFTIISILVNAL